MSCFVQLFVTYKGECHDWNFLDDATLTDLFEEAEARLGIPMENQKFLISPKPGLVKLPFKNESLAALPLLSIERMKFTLIGSTNVEISSLTDSIQSSQARSQRHLGGGPIKAAVPTRTRDWKKVHDNTTYTFLQIKPLPYLPNPERSTKFLERLRDDPGIKSSMAKHKWSVPLLTEMNPAEHTTQDSRTLGLNRNAGEVIELRLRTDAYDGYRDYKVIRNTLCHELAHNVHGEHDRKFWDLCHDIEREVAQNDWKSGGHTVSNQEYYEPSNEDDVHDHGGWTGGEYVVGASSVSETTKSRGPVSRMDRREILARAAEERNKRAKEGSGQPSP